MCLITDITADILPVTANRTPAMTTLIRVWPNMHHKLYHLLIYCALALQAAATRCNLKYVSQDVEIVKYCFFMELILQVVCWLCWFNTFLSH